MKPGRSLNAGSSFALWMERPLVERSSPSCLPILRRTTPVSAVEESALFSCPQCGIVLPPKLTYRPFTVIPVLLLGKI